MKHKTIKYKAGRITLYNKNTDPDFGGSLLIKKTKKVKDVEKPEVRADVLAEVLSENFSHNLDAVIQSLHIKNAQSQPVTLPDPVSEPIMQIEEQSEEKNEEDHPDLFKKEPPVRSPKSKPSKNILKEYKDLIDFPALFKFIFHIGASSLRNILAVIRIAIKNIKSSFEENFYVEDSKPQEISGVNKFSNAFSNIKAKIVGNSQTLVRGVAVTCLIVAILSIGSILLPLSTAQIGSMIQKSNAQKTEAVKQLEPTPDPQKLLAQSLEVDPSKDAQVSTEFVLEVPGIGLVSDIAPNVDLDNEEVYKQKLKETGVAHAKGSYFPGEAGPVYLFAHSTDTVFNISAFNAKFFALKDLAEGDEIKINYHGTMHTYKVTSRTIINPTELDTIRDSTSDLILQTCWPPGTDWQRLIVFAQEQKTVASN